MNNPNPNWDERMEAMRQTMELLQAESLATGRKVDKLAATVEAHEREWERFRRAMRAGLEEWFSDNGDEQGE